jgi:hypothetical protein
MKPPRNRTRGICVAFKSQSHDTACVQDPDRFRANLLSAWARHPDRSPEVFASDFTFHDRSHSRKRDVWLRRIKVWVKESAGARSQRWREW